MKIRRRLLVGSLLTATVASVVIGWAIARSNDGSGADGGDSVVIAGGPATFEVPNIATNADVEGAPLPVATVQTLLGDEISTAEFVGQPLVINIWGSTCGPCKRELPDFAAAHATYGDRVRFVGISYLPPSDREEQFARDYGIQYELFYDADGNFVAAAGIASFPVTLFVRPDGTIAAQTGQLDEAQLAETIEGALL